MNRFDIEKSVENALWIDLQARNDDYYLVRDVLIDYANYKRRNGDLDCDDFSRFLNKFLTYYKVLLKTFPSCPSLESIKRWRRRKQAEKEAFRADEPVRTRRSKLAKEYKEKMKKDKERISR